MQARKSALKPTTEGALQWMEDNNKVMKLAKENGALCDMMDIMPYFVISNLGPANADVSISICCDMCPNICV